MLGILNQFHRRPICTFIFRNGIAMQTRDLLASDEKNRKIISDNNIKDSMRKKQFSEILRGWFVYKLFTFDKLVENSDNLTKIAQKVFGAKLFEKLLKMTIYGHFVAGEEKSEVMQCISKLREGGIKCVLDYSAEEDVLDEDKVSHEIRAKLKVEFTSSGLTEEDLQSSTKEFRTTEQAGVSVKQASARTYFYENEIKCDKNRDIFMECIRLAAASTEKGKGFAALKITALSNPNMLLKFSEKFKLRQDLFFKLATDKNSNSLYSQPALISQESFSKGLADLGFTITQQTQQDMFSQLKYENASTINTGIWQDLYTEDTELYELMKSQESTKHYAPVLRPVRKVEYGRAIERLITLAEYSKALKVRLMIDAEQSYFQDAINYITVHYLMPKYNQQFPTIFNTHQCYLRRSYENVLNDIEYAEIRGFKYGLKLVRGAYMGQERTRSRELNYPDPILPNIEATHEMYHTVMEICLNKVKLRLVNLMIASHNKDSVERAVELMRDLSISPKDGVAFGQLLGMCDYISFPLAQSGYQVYKYTPYGPIKEVIPYLARRALENRGLLKGADFERKVLGEELKRRLFTWS
ncbi:Proline dehydrogenase 1, mitochondrial-like isoform X2 [Oopsacas minuta]|uniref:Proline dehydrogenase n=1 Tax=Oopsacas minuta TaxID=111878 RepID=A0AAV7K983_9METZ|nr:Proline dehydrogenase 1, mitochondrial-like isoform X2 [Oopsacas minuta]